MKLKIFTILFAVMASIGGLFAQALITIDGNFSDWGGGNLLVVR